MLDKKHFVILLQKGMTQQEIAEKMGVHQPKVSEWLRGLRTPNSKTILKLALKAGAVSVNLLKFFNFKLL